MGTDRAAIVDVETTGISRQDVIVEIAVLLFTFSRETGEFLSRDDYYQGYQEPGFEIDPAATAVHGLTRDNLRGKEIDRRTVQSLFSQADFLVAHNAVFDRGFVSRAFPEFSHMEWRCSMRSINWIRTGCENKQLQTILAHHNIIPSRAHSAYDDVACLYDLLASIDRKTGRPYFSDVMASRPVRTKFEMAAEEHPENYLTGIYVDEWEEWMASYLRSSSKTKLHRWNALTPGQQDFLREEYGLREQDTLFS